jgi:hypothetical protein
MASSTSRTASWTTVASHAAIPLGRVFPGPVGIGTRRRGCWRYRGAFRRACRLWRCASRSRPSGSFVTPSTPTAASARCRRYARARAGTSLRCASAWNRPSGSRGARSTPFTSPGDLAANVAAVGLGPSCSAPQHGPPVLDRVRGPPRAPASPLVCRPPTPCPHRPRLRFPVPGAYLAAGACSLPLRPTTRAPAHLSCVGDGAPVLRHTGVYRGEARAFYVAAVVKPSCLFFSPRYFLDTVSHRAEPPCGFLWRAALPLPMPLYRFGFRNRSIPADRFLGAEMRENLRLMMRKRGCSPPWPDG